MSTKFQNEMVYIVVPFKELLTTSRMKYSNGNLSVWLQKKLDFYFVCLFVCLFVVCSFVCLYNEIPGVPTFLNKRKNKWLCVCWSLIRKISVFAVNPVCPRGTKSATVTVL